MARIVPSRVIQTIDELFPHAAKGPGRTMLLAQHSSRLLGILNLLKSIPDELITVDSSDYSDLVLAESTIEAHLETWKVRDGEMTHLKGSDIVTVIRRVLAKCPDEYPPSTTTELVFIQDTELRDSIRRDVGAANRALNNAEWKAATVLSGASIEALLHWRLQEQTPGLIAVQSAVTALVSGGVMSKPDNDVDRWELHHFIEVAGRLGLLKRETCIAAGLARTFRNLIHPGRAARLAQTCDRATAYSAVGALEHVIRDLS